MVPVPGLMQADLLKALQEIGHAKQAHKIDTIVMEDYTLAEQVDMHVCCWS